MIHFLKITIILQQIEHKAFPLENGRESPAEEVWLFFCELIQKRTSYLNPPTVKGTQLNPPTNFLLLKQLLLSVNWMFPLLFLLPWSTDGYVVCGSDYSNFDRRWRDGGVSVCHWITSGKYGPTSGSITAISVQGKRNCFNVSRLAC